MPFGGGDVERIGAESLAESGEFGGAEQRQRAETAAIPEHHLAGKFRPGCRIEPPDNSQVVPGRGIGYEQKSRHAWFNNQHAEIVEFEDYAFAEPSDTLQSMPGQLFEGVSVRRNTDGFAVAGRELNRLNAAVFAVGANSADHGFHFGEFGHVVDFRKNSSGRKPNFSENLRKHKPFHTGNFRLRQLNLQKCINHQKDTVPVTTAASLNPQALFLQHEGWLRTVVRSRLPEAEAVEDVMQNIALAIVRQRSLLADVNRVGAWLYQIAIRQVLMYRRTTGRRRKFHDRLQQQTSEVTDVAEPLQALLKLEAKELVQRALAELSDIDRQVLMLKYAEGWSYRCIAEHLGVREDTIEYRLSRARNHLRRQLRTFAEESAGT